MSAAVGKSVGRAEAILFKDFLYRIFIPYLCYSRNCYGCNKDVVL